MFRNKVRGSCSEFHFNSAAVLGVTDVGGSATEGFLWFLIDGCDRA